MKNKKYCKTVTEHFFFSSPHSALFLNLLFYRVNYYQWLYIYIHAYAPIFLFLTFYLYFFLYK